jgi:hypothetical protein
MYTPPYAAEARPAKSASMRVSSHAKATRLATPRLSHMQTAKLGRAAGHRFPPIGFIPGKTPPRSFALGRSR